MDIMKTSVRTITNYKRTGIQQGDCMYLFEKPLIRGVMLKRKSQFTALISVDDEEMIAHMRLTLSSHI